MRSVEPEARRRREQRLVRAAGIVFLGAGLVAAVASFCLGAFFFPIGPEGLAARDLVVRQISDIWWFLAIVFVGSGLLVLAASALLARRR